MRPVRSEGVERIIADETARRARRFESTYIRMMPRALVLIPLLLSGAVRAERVLTLPEAVALSVARSEALAAGAAGVAEAEARIAELRAAALPRLSLNATQKFQDSAGGDAVASRFNESSQQTLWLGLRQPLFAGFREFLLLRAGRALSEAESADLARAEALLTLDVARAYTGLWRTRGAITIRTGARDLMAERVKDLEERSRVGRSRASEVLAARAQLAREEAQLERLRGDDTAAEDRLRFLTGVEERLAPSPLASPVLPPLEPLLAAATDRADVKARRRELAAAELSAVAARRERWPVLNADGAYYLERPGISEDVRWDATISAQFPLFAGGAITARVRSAEAVRHAAAERAALAARLAALEVRTAHRELEAALRSVTALAAAEALSAKNAEAQADDYKNGLVTNLEVLGALDTLMETRLQLEDARLDAALGAVAVDVAAGRPVAR